MRSENYPIDPNNQSKNLEPLTSLSFIQPNYKGLDYFLASEI